jgi:predicted nucleic acid-binding protein
MPSAASPRGCVVDTSAWIEFLMLTPLGKKLAPHFPAQDQCIVPTLVQLELSKWMLREMGEEEADQVIAYTQECVVSPLDTTIALLAAQLNKDHKLVTADAIVYATALNKGATLLTCDAHFEHLPHVVYLSKKTIH